MYKLRHRDDPDKCRVLRCTNAVGAQVMHTGYLCLKHSAEWREDRSQFGVESEREDEWKQQAMDVAQETKDALRVLRDFTIETEEDVEFAVGELESVKAFWDELEKKRTAITKPMNAALRETNKLFKEPQGLLKELEALWKEKLVERKVVQEQERQRLLEAAGDAEDADDAREALIAAGDVADPGGVSFRDNWTFEVVDAELVPREYLMVDEKAIASVVKGLKEKTDIPGVRVFNKPIVAAKSRK